MSRRRDPVFSLRYERLPIHASCESAQAGGALFFAPSFVAKQKKGLALQGETKHFRV
jgi:hypothetical protein